MSDTKCLYYNGGDFGASDYVVDPLNSTIKAANWKVPMYELNDLTSKVRGYITWQSVAFVKPTGDLDVTETISLRVGNRAKMGTNSYRNSNGYYQVGEEFNFDLVGNATAPRRTKNKDEMPYKSVSIARVGDTSWRKVTLSKI